MPEQRKKVGEKTATEEETEKKMRKKRKKNHYYEKEEKKLLLIAIESICRLLFTRIDRSDKKGTLLLLLPLLLTTHKF